MRPKLLKSFIVVLLFWFLFSTVWWTLASPETNYKALVALQKLLPFINLKVPAEISIMGAWRVQISVLAYWTAPILLGSAMFGAVGLGLVWTQAARQSKERAEREAGSGSFREVTITRGELPLPKTWPRDELDLGADDDSALSRMTEKERVLLGDVLGTLSAHPDAYPGEGVRVSLLEHALNLASKALTHRRYPGLSAVVAAAHELGKIEAYVKRGDTWTAIKDHDREASRILGTLTSWWALPEADRNAVMMAVKFHSRPRQIPDVNGDPAIYRQAREILDAADGAQAEALTEQKTQTLEKLELPDLILEGFLQALPQLSFQSRGLPKGVQAVAWKVKNRVYMLEIKLRDTVLAKLPQEVRGALAPNPKERSRLQPFTLALLKALDEKGWLVRKHESTKLEVKEALWNVKAGKLEFKGVIIIDVPEEYMTQLPKEDSMYDVAISGTLFTPSASTNAATVAGTAISKGDLLGSVLKPATPREKPPAPPAEV
ncbi:MULTISPECIES: hypothetical protein [unclassified Variovorax]|uniref:hypothetical protein n=1 Tax=unclassified Variovorax TaxID=663243 RepID=UPI00076BD00E|nr:MULTISPECIES: hypothetical protein [unclassified Variovorax]KWT98300.1 hypothetical protein APY03_0435 [Variovorax sp. WDL1]PNG50045.1 hypothetical protein CHC06_05626 [Variovorax sp. B2]PNG50917.1 hypothetical protein CHC07_05531 [Variovorax sp. B4]VTU41578.1 hypothetical protein SRS16P1_00039 [Variovorax sp. SRS16]VTU41607.1 hypothetical protein E5P1_00039 [Variovorax sp. PBL-E5]